MPKAPGYYGGQYRNLASFPKGLFAPGRFSIDTLSAFNPRSPAQPQSLTKKEKDIFAWLAQGDSPGSFASFMRAADVAIIREEIGFAAQPPAHHEALQRFYRRALAGLDGAFDKNRSAFAPAAAKGAAVFLTALYATPIRRFGGGPEFTAGEALRIIDKLIADPTSYSPLGMALLKSDFDDFINVGMAEIGRKDSSKLSVSQTQSVKEITNGLYAALLFDIAYGSLIAVPGYARARDKHIAANLAFQYNDDTLDIFSDVDEGSANLFIALAIGFAEIKELIGVRSQLTGLLPSSGLDLEDSSTLFSYYHSLRQIAPKSYAFMAARQSFLLKVSSLSADISRKVALPLSKKA